MNTRRPPLLAVAWACLALLTLVAIGGSRPAGAATTADSLVVFSDSTFADADWTSSLIVAEDYGGCPGTANMWFTTIRDSVGGDLGAYRRVDEGWSDGAIYVAHLRNGAVYEPAVSGAIANLDFDQDVRFLSNPDEPPYAMGCELLALQDGTWYAVPFAYNQNQWTWTSVSGLTENSFVKVAGSGPGTPDFSAKGSPLQFGFGTRNAGVLCTDYVCALGVDNWRVEVIPVPPETTTAVGTNWVGLTLLAPTPTPMRDRATIGYALPASARVRVELFDAAGRRVRTLAEGEETAGAHALEWDGRDAGGNVAPAGSYYVRLAALGRVLTRHVVRLR